MRMERLSRSQTAVLVVDIQERLQAAMPEQTRERFVQRVAALLDGAAALGLPIVYTEQYPKGLGATVASLQPKLNGAARFEKTTFSAVSEPLLQAFQGRSRILVAGVETHVCVYQSVRDLVAKGLTVELLADAVCSRAEEDRRVGLELCRAAGAGLHTVESALFDLLEIAGTPEFKQVSAAVR